MKQHVNIDNFAKECLSERCLAKRYLAKFLPNSKRGEEMETLLMLSFDAINFWAQTPEESAGSSMTVNGERLTVSKGLLEVARDNPPEIEHMLVAWIMETSRFAQPVAFQVNSMTSESAYMITSYPPNSPPKLGQVLLRIFLPPNTRKALIGDLAEDYDDAYKRFGPTAAKRLYWWDVVRSLFPILEAFIVRTSKWVGLVALGKMFQHFVK